MVLYSADSKRALRKLREPQQRPAGKNIKDKRVEMAFQQKRVTMAAERGTNEKTILLHF